MTESRVGVDGAVGEWRTWRPVLAMVIVLVIMAAAAVARAQPAWLVIGLIGPATLAGDEAARRRRHRRAAVPATDGPTQGLSAPNPPSMR